MRKQKIKLGKIVNLFIREESEPFNCFKVNDKTWDFITDPIIKSVEVFVCDNIEHELLIKAYWK